MNLEQTNEKLSVIIPIYNVEPYLRQCLDSVINQTYRNLEIILVDDGSPDNSGAICEEYARRDDRIVVIHKQNGGLSAARNDGIERATGEWIAFVDSDDWCDVDYYERLFDAIRDQNIDIFCAGGWFKEYNNKTIECCSFTDSVLFEGKAQIDFLVAKTLVPQYGNQSDYCLGAPWNKLYNRSFLLRNQLRFDTTLNALEDLLFNYLAFNKAKRVAACSSIGYHLRKQVSTSVTTRFNPRMPGTYIVYINSLYDYMRHREPNELIYDLIGVRTLASFGHVAKRYYFHKDNPNPYRVTAAEVKKMKIEPVLRDAIRSNNNQYLSKKILVLKYLLRLPWIWPLKLAYSAKQMLPGQG